MATVNFIARGDDIIMDTAREALIDIQPKGFFIRPPPAQHELDETLTPDALLFQTIHMGTALVDTSRWRLVLDGLVERPFSITLAQLRQMPAKSIISFHECYGSPLNPPPTKNVWRIGNVQWTGVPLWDLLSLARPHADRGLFVWSDGLDSGTFAGVEADRYQKDLPIEKARCPEVLVGYEMNGQPLNEKRGGPVRLVVPGWFGTNSTKWLCRLSVQETRARGSFTTVFYNEPDPVGLEGNRTRPVWAVQPNSIIVRPRPREAFACPAYVEGWGRAWGAEEIAHVAISPDGDSWVEASVAPRKQFEWQLFRFQISITQPRRHNIKARATDKQGARQPLVGSRNHVPTVQIEVSPSGSGTADTGVNLTLRENGIAQPEEAI